MWVSPAERLFQVGELSHTLGMEEEFIDLDIRNSHTVERLLLTSRLPPGLLTTLRESATPIARTCLAQWLLISSRPTSTLGL